MKNSLLLHVSWVFFLTITLSACASYPEEQLQEAQTAMDEAKEQSADVFAAADWESAVGIWDEAQEQLEQEKFSPAKTALLRAKSRFNKARDIAQAKRQTLLKQINDQQHTLNVRYSYLKSDLAASRVSGSARKEIDQGCLDLNKQVESLATQIEQGDLVQAHGTAEEALSQLYQLELKFQQVSGKR